MTTARGNRWSLDPKTAVLPDPLLRGSAGPSGIHVADFRESLGGNRYGSPSWLDARIEPAAGGGTTLTGTVGPLQDVTQWRAGFGCVYVGILVLIGIGVFTTGVVLLSRGDIASSMPDLLIPAVGFPVLIYLVKAVRWSETDRVTDSTADLMRKVTGLLDAAADFPDGP